MQDTRQVYVDKVLTNVMLQYPQADFIAEQVLPTLNVPDLTGIAFKLDEQNIVAPGSSLRQGLSRAKRVSWNLTQQSYGPLAEHSLETPVTDLVMSQYQTPLVPETTATGVVTGQLLIEKEIAVQQLVGTVANYASGFATTLSGTSQFSSTSSTFETPINTARETVRLGCGHYPNTAIMSAQVRNALRQHPEIQARLQGAVAVTNDQRDAVLKDILNVDTILVGKAVTSTQQEGTTTTGTKTDIWGKDLVLLYITPEPAIETLTFGYLLRLNPKNALGGGSAPLVGVDKWYEQERKATIIRGNDFYTTWTVANTAGYLFKNAVA